MNYTDMQPHQKRVVDEKRDLDEKIGRLVIFRQSGTYQSLPEEEIVRLSMQLKTMELYSQILGQRIAAF